MLTIIFNQNVNTKMGLSDFNRDISVQNNILQSVGFLSIKQDKNSEKILEELAKNGITALTIAFEDEPIYEVEHLHASIVSITNHLENNVILADVEIKFN